MCSPIEDWHGTTEAGTWPACTVSYNQIDKTQGRPGELPMPMYCNEMLAQDSRSSGYNVNIGGRLYSLLPGTQIDQAGKCIVLQCDALCCSVLQYVAACCSVL